MLKFVGNAFNIKITWISRLRFFYIFAKMHALAHFSYDKETNEVSFSIVSAVCGSIFVVGYFLLLIFILYVLDELVDDTDGSVVLYFVNAIELITIALKAFTIYLLQIIHSKDLVLLINNAIGIDQAINNEHRQNTKLYGRHFVELYNFKKWCLLLQVVLLWASYYIYVELSGHDTKEMIFSFIIVYSHFSTVIVSGLYFYGSLLFGYEFYNSLNGQVKRILQKIELNKEFRTDMESYCQACEELEKISLVYTRISSSITSINRTFAVRIAFELLGSFLIITCSVSRPTQL